MARGIMCSCGCRSIVTDINPKNNRIFSKCEKARIAHKKQQSKRRQHTRTTGMEHARTPGGSLIYDTRAWRRLSDKKRTVDPFCERCLKEGRHKVADLVDHRVEILDDPKLAYNWDNLESICHFHHNNKTKDEKDARDGKDIFVYG